MEFSFKVNSNSPKFLNAAEQIGISLCKRAFWSNSRCNWIGRSIQETDSMTVSSYNKALSPDVYEGTGGIALFMINLYSIDKNEQFRIAAEGAINQALSKIEELQPISRFGLFSGKLGVAYVATRIGKNLDNNFYIEKSLGIFENLQNKFQDPHLMDVISGNASAIPILIDLYQFFREERLLELSIKLGEELIDNSIKESYGWSWDGRANSIMESSNNLTGFSHGTAGIGCALLELYNATKEIKFLDAAKKAFSYEDYWFNVRNNNWPDFRVDKRIRGFKKSNVDLNYAFAWCHGAPGIGLSRLRAYDLLKDEEYFRDSKLSTETSVKFLEQNIHRTNNTVQDFSLCHGLSGVCETLLYANQVLKDNRYKLIADNVGLYGIEHYLNTGISWPCGIKGTETPGLMLGIAGIGNFYLRLFESQKTTSPLIILPS